MVTFQRVGRRAEVIGTGGIEIVSRRGTACPMEGKMAQQTLRTSPTLDPGTVPPPTTRGCEHNVNSAAAAGADWYPSSTAVGQRGN